MWKTVERAMLCAVFIKWMWIGNVFLEGFVVCIVGKMAQDVGMVENIVVSSPSSLVGF